MIALGIRVSSQIVRYAMVEWSDGTPKLINMARENRLVFPAAISSLGDKSKWLYDEFERIIRQDRDISGVYIKENEYVIEKCPMRESSYLVGSLILFAAQHNLPVRTFLYTNLKTKRKDIKAVAESRIGKSTQYWDEQMADAVVAAWKGGMNGWRELPIGRSDL